MKKQPISFSQASPGIGQAFREKDSGYVPLHPSSHTQPRWLEPIGSYQPLPHCSLWRTKETRWAFVSQWLSMTHLEPSLDDLQGTGDRCAGRASQPTRGEYKLTSNYIAAAKPRTAYKNPSNLGKNAHFLYSSGFFFPAPLDFIFNRAEASLSRRRRYTHPPATKWVKDSTDIASTKTTSGTGCCGSRR